MTSSAFTFPLYLEVETSTQSAYWNNICDHKHLWRALWVSSNRLRIVSNHWPVLGALFFKVRLKSVILLGVFQVPLFSRSLRSPENIALESRIWTPELVPPAPTSEVSEVLEYQTAAAKQHEDEGPPEHCHYVEDQPAGAGAWVWACMWAWVAARVWAWVAARMWAWAWIGAWVWAWWEKHELEGRGFIRTRLQATECGWKQRCGNSYGEFVRWWPVHMRLCPHGTVQLAYWGYLPLNHKICGVLYLPFVEVLTSTSPEKVKLKLKIFFKTFWQIIRFEL